ncbi:Fanconi anemia group G protein [Eucyclogobius newberryi]|uniref:Fanconi anemia group G protein n=1 Tax=Eucyclogobius newberryi TaxID=166745 RepID=UPI003B5B5F24
MYKATALLEKWIQENNDLVTKWKKLTDGNNLRKDQRLSNLRCLALEFHKLLSKIQGAPHLAGVTQLELMVIYNASVFSIALSEFSKVELLITNVMDKVLQISGCSPTPGSSDYLLFWRKVLEKAIERTDLFFCFGQLFCLQWAIWVAMQKYHIIQETEKEMSMVISTENKNKGELSDSLLLVLEPKELIELLHVCTLIGKGAERLTNGQYSEALSVLQKATSFSAPRGVVACSHLLLGSCFLQMKRPHMALVCFRKALEIDCQCVSALYQSMLIYRQLGNKPAEIQALVLLHSVLNLTHTSECNTGDGQLISSALLLSSPSLKNLLEVPSALTVLHNLALRCVHCGRVSEGVEHYLDLFAILHTDQPNSHVLNEEVPFLPRLAEIYLEAAAAMIMVQRPADCIALCEEVVGTALDLLPKRLVLEESSIETEPNDIDVDHNDKGALVLWAGAANLLKGHCYMHLKDWQQAMTHFTRCLNLIVRVHFKKKGGQPQIPTTDMVNKDGSKLFTLQRLKAFSLAGRGICFAQTDRLKEALRDLHLSLHAFPECVSAGLWCGEVLWRLQRRPEAASCWKKTLCFTSESSNSCVYLMEPPTDHMLSPSELQRRIEDLGFEEVKNG